MKRSPATVCLLDPDGDIVRWLLAENKAEISPHWACCHTDLYRFDWQGQRFGIIGNAVGAPFAVLLAEQLFVSGCELLVSITSAGQIDPKLELPCFVMIDRALRDEGTSYHYLPPGKYSEAPVKLIEKLEGAFDPFPLPVYRGAAWTTDAPYRETETAITANRQRGIMAVEMEAAALYAFASAKAKPVICFAHITNQMAQDKGDFEKGDADGADASLAVLAIVAKVLRKGFEWLS